jgi:hypothetical protein
VRAIFQRYLELGSLKQTCARLRADNVRSKLWTTRAGKVMGGLAFSTGALRYFLSNRIYRGEIRHKQVWRPGLHPAIVDGDLFEAVQARLVQHEPRGRSGAVPSGAPLQGLVFDDAGNRMSPSHVEGRGGRRFHYYVSQALKRSDKARGSLARVGATAREGQVQEIAARITACGQDWPSLRQRLHRVVVGRDVLGVELCSDVVDPDACAGRVAATETMTIEQGVVRVSSALDARPWRGFAYRYDRDGRRSSDRELDMSLADAMAKAHAWRNEWLGPGGVTYAAIAEREGIDLRYVLRLAKLAYLAPDIVRAVLSGRGVKSLSVARLTLGDLPMDWAEQRRLFLAAGAS